MIRALFFIFASTVLSRSASGAPLNVRLLSNVPSPQPVGTAIGLMPHIENPGKGMLVFRYSAKIGNGPLRIIRDFSQQKNFVWSPPLYEHDASVYVTVRNNETKETADDKLPFRVISRITSSSPVITPTANSLIALFSAPACDEGGKFRAAFQLQGGQDVYYTPAESCHGTRSNNVYVAGMRPDSDYRLRAEVITGKDVKPGPWMPFRTGLLDGEFPPVSIAVPRAAGSRAPQPVLIHSVATSIGGGRPFATDQDGNMIWYLRSVDFLTRVLPGGRLLVLSEGANSVNDMRRLQIVREVDLAGGIVRETNVGRIAEQLESRGIHSNCKRGSKECVSSLHHEAIRLPNGHTLILAGIERMFPAGTQGAKEDVDILGDLIIDLDDEFQVSAAWNSFDHLDVKRASVQDTKCQEGAGKGGCPPIFLAAEANAWLHSNSLNYIPATGDLLLSIPEQDWVIKIDWRNGKGTGKILWRLGQGGDFTAKTSDPNPWFSYQHDARFDPPGSNLIVVLDNGRTRKKKVPAAHTRGQVWKLDEKARTAALVYNADLGVYSVAVGSAQSLKNGGYTFDAGFINYPWVYSRSIETSADGNIAYAQQVEGAVVYRSFRVADVYSAPVN